MTAVPPMFAETITATDPAEAAGQLRNTYGDVEVCAGPGRHFDVQIASSLVGGAVAHRIDTRGGAGFRFAQQFDGYALVMLHEGGLAVSEGGSLREWAPGTCVVLDTNRIDTWQWRGGRYEMLMASAADIRQRLSRLLDAPVTRTLTFQTEVAADSDGVRLARALTDLMHGCFADGLLAPGAQATAASVRDVVVSTFLETLPHSYSERLRRKAPALSPRHIRAAVDFIHAHAQHSISVEDIAAAARTSVRTLQAGFAAFRATTPMAYLRQVRLEGVRAELLQSADASIAEVAGRWRFTHLGLFARAYREAFGELPSQTRRFSSR